jgi:hypothetical protein
MKQVIQIEMSSDQIVNVEFGSRIIIGKDGEFISIYIYDEIAEDFATIKEAEKALASWAINDDLIITGCGIHAGRKFWQLPEKLQAKIHLMARKA